MNPKLRIGSVSFLNARPLIHGLETQPDLDLHFDVPSRLLSGLQSARYDVALLPVIDYDQLPGARMIPSGGIGCDGPTLTVRIFSPKPIEQITTLACDPDSHTSVALARIILSKRYGKEPRLIELNRSELSADQPMLLIGDKVITHAPANMPHQLDLGEAWKELTGLPFVFAIWTAAPNVDLRDLPTRLETARRQGMENLPAIVEQHAKSRGWPADLAMRYFTEFLKFEIGKRQLEGIGRFLDLAHEQGLIGKSSAGLGGSRR